MAFLKYIECGALLFVGPVASGKSTAAQRVHEQFGHRRVSIGAPVYQIAREIFGMTTKDRALLRTIGMTGRALDPDTWIRKCIESLEDNTTLSELAHAKLGDASTNAV